MMTRKVMVVCDISVVDFAIDVISEFGSEMIFVTILPKNEDGTRVYLERVLEKGDPEDFRDVDDWYEKFSSLTEPDYSVSIWRS